MHDGFGGHADHGGGGHGHGFSDMDIGHGFGHGHNDLGVGHYGGGHHGGTFASDALMVAHSHCDPHGWAGSFHHVSVEVSGMFGHHHSPTATYGGAAPQSENEEAFREKVRRALADPNRRYYGAHVVGHGGLNVPEDFGRIAKTLGMIRICNAVANFNPVDETRDEILDWNAALSLKIDPEKPLTETQKERLAKARPPAGFVKGAVGTTRIWKQYWQVGTRPGMWPFQGKPKYDRLKKTYVEVKLVTWYFADIGDYETRFEMNIVSVPVWRTFKRPHRIGANGVPCYDEEVAGLPEGQWFWKRTPWTEHQKACDKLIAGLFEELKKAPPCKPAQEKRRAIALARRAARERGGVGADLDNVFAVTSGATSNAPPPTGKTVAVEVELLPPSAMKGRRKD